MGSTSRPLFKIQLEKSTYYKSLEGTSGVVVRGSLLFTPTFQIKVNRIFLRFQGKYVATSTRDIRKTEKSLIEKQWVFFSAGRRSQTINGGSYKYDFEITLSDEFPESCKLEYGSVQYKFKAVAETSLMFSNLKDEKEVFLRQNIGSWVDTIYQTEIHRNWRNALDINIRIPANQFKLGSVVPLAFQTRVSNDSARVVLVSCMLKEYVILRSPQAYGSSRPIIRDQDRKVGMAFAWCQRADNYENILVEIKIPANRCTYDCSNEYVSISHKLHIRVDIKRQGNIESISIPMPICIVPRTSCELGPAELEIEELPGYEMITSPPSYELATNHRSSFNDVNLHTVDLVPSFPPRYSVSECNISVH
ncbi:hypothetical protein K7432_013259 [Basidiobolus ranarum]|uniref:Arrestin C-terminal-like domain-containing protein n=1 Tax=Basidiobolus ranarum TaxID=34480 RepID=A0ABR2WJN7_9FUNG